MKSESESYRRAGVDITAGYEAVRRMLPHVRRTDTPGVLSGLGGFGGLFQPDLTGVRQPVLVSGTDGVGTKLRLAFALDKHDTVGIDCVAMSVNDILCAGAKPLFFLDYIACGKLDPARAEAIVSGVAEGCVQAECALIGGETAEMPDSYPAGEYDLAGFAVGLADKEKIPDTSRVRPGDALIALPSSGLHSNGFSLARRVFGDTAKRLAKRYDDLGQSIGEALLAPTRIYARAVRAMAEAVQVKSLAHITGGGFYENIPRALPEGLEARVEKARLQTPPLFDILAREGGIPPRDMFNTFNMGVGMLAIVAEADADAAVRALAASGVAAYVSGRVAAGERGVTLC